MPTFLDAFRAWADAAAAERRAHGFLWLGLMEADPRSMGGESLTWARKPDGQLYVRVVGSGPTWEPITDAEFRRRWPHARMPPTVPQEGR